MLKRIKKLIEVYLRVKLKCVIFEFSVICRVKSNGWEFGELRAGRTEASEEWQRSFATRGQVGFSLFKLRRHSGRTPAICSVGEGVLFHVRDI
jgi:hypothetical protein